MNTTRFAAAVLALCALTPLALCAEGPGIREGARITPRQRRTLLLNAYAWSWGIVSWPYGNTAMLGFSPLRRRKSSTSADTVSPTSAQ